MKNIFGPADEAGQISLVLDVTTDSEVSGLGFEKSVLNLVGLLLLSLLVGFLNLRN